MSESIYMSFEGVNGESEVPGISAAPANGGWIALTSCTLSAHPRARKTDDMHVHVQPVVVTKETDGATIGLLGAALFGAPDKHVVITFVRTSPDGPAEYMRVELLNAGIIGWDIDSSAERPSESFAIRCGEIEINSWAFDGNTRGARANSSISNEV